MPMKKMLNGVPSTEHQGSIKRQVLRPVSYLDDWRKITKDSRCRTHSDVFFYNIYTTPGAPETRPERRAPAQN